MRKFDKWLFGKAINRAERRGRRQAEERIIKLLDEVLKFDSEQEKRNLFALIKGEQK